MTSVFASLAMLLALPSPYGGESSESLRTPNPRETEWEEAEHWTPLNWIPTFGLEEKWKENLRHSFDLSYRSIYNTRTENGGGVLALGLDIHNVFSTRSGDVGTLILQPYLTRIDNVDKRPGFFEGEDDWEMVFRIFNFNYTQLFRNKLNLRVGHMELPFGLEHTINTNGTLRDYLHGPNLGVKADWGASLNGELDFLEYEIAWTRGTGNEWTERGNPGIVSGRVGSPREDLTAFGVSFMTGDVLTPKGIVERERFGVDAAIVLGAYNLLGEVSYGSDFKTEVMSTLIEVNWRDEGETLLPFLQVVEMRRKATSDWDEALSTRLGVRYAPAQDWSASFQWKQGISALGNGRNDGVLFAQLRYRF